MSNKYLNPNEDSISIYMRDVRKSDLITAEKEVELAKKILDGDKRALDELVKANLRFVIKIAKGYQNQGLAAADLISEGNYGLITAAKKFDHTKGFRFNTYAVWWIKQSIMQSLNDNSRTVRLPGSVINKLSKIRKEVDIFEKENQRSPYDDEVEQISIPSCTSLNTTINEDGDELLTLIEDKTFTRPDQMGDEDDMMRKNEMNRALNGLSQREIEIINCYFGLNGEPMTLEMIGEEVDLTKERVRQIKESAIRKVRDNLGGIFNI
jgi:RNA polymerase primary sigma factor